MAGRIEDYALIGDCETAALVGLDGSIDWLPLPRFDADACFCALVGTDENGRWRIGPTSKPRHVRRRYRDCTLVLETEFELEHGRVRLLDFMPPRDRRVDVVRIVEGLAGRVDMEMELVIRFGYGAVTPWVRRTDDGIFAVAGPDALYLDAEAECRGEGFRTTARFSVGRGERKRFVLTWNSSTAPRPARISPDKALASTDRFWKAWGSRATYEGPWKDAVLGSLLTLKALTYAPTGGIVAAPTTSLPEAIGGARNWDYRYCWIRDATSSLYALLNAGYTEEARAFREWLVRAVAGHPSEMQIMYGVAGERRLPEIELSWLRGYEGSGPVRIGNAAATQHQIDVYGEVMDTMHLAHRSGIERDENAWRVQRSLLDFLESDWIHPDEGIWEVRGPRQHFTHSKVMAWVAVDRAVKGVEDFGFEGPVDRWRSWREEVHRDVCARGFDDEMGTFVQAYGSKHLDASLLMIPLVGFLPPDDPRVRGTVDAIERGLMDRGFVRRYAPESHVDGIDEGEGAFLLCTFWLADNVALQGRRDDAVALFERLLALRNDVGLLSEEYDPVAGRFLGNFPQAFSHVALVNTARNLSHAGGPAEDRSHSRHRPRSSS